MDGALKEVISIFSGITVLAIIATLVSRNANTANIITSTFGGFSKAVQVAEGPVSGNSGLSGIEDNLNGFGSNFGF